MLFIPMGKIERVRPPDPCTVLSDTASNTPMHLGAVTDEPR